MKAKTKKNPDFRSTCPISSALDLVGDKWSLLIIRDLCFFGKRTFSEFSLSEEGIAANILADRLKKFEEYGIIVRGKVKENKKTVVYSLTDKGIDLIPIMVEFILWSDKHLGHHIAGESRVFAQSLRKDKEKIIQQIAGSLREKRPPDL